MLISKLLKIIVSFWCYFLCLKPHLVNAVGKKLHVLDICVVVFEHSLVAMRFQFLRS